MNNQLLMEIWQHHGGKLMGALFGFVFGILVLHFGFFKTVFIVFCVGAGYVVGKRIDEKEDIMDILDKLLPPSYHR
ncbi:MAG TPA: hypothetical protein DCP36_16810 [Sporomusaceae bacterium]|jgi:uncharacterized membrane protein|uniref:DUF2273 domain-containing protein n=1 Tax=Anaerospora sp. TaxID=1960278 RepID=UPI000EC5D58B|nr:DUF2273 domain-containing protein [Anaerospora sp.]MDF2927847.1 hypothetical protein [Anaerospora sp.]HAK74785.1 hypothetical protein [Sporomusaceae bacterium]